ncbi:MAG: endolytic transglycosylase MltG [Gammaproteobacteria bacterium]|nr:endolytic transglycosylase MltG [Gammaproteobacteria bacterium]
MTKHKLLAFILVLTTLVFLVLTSLTYQFFRVPLVKKNEKIAVKVYPGQDVTMLATHLYARNIIRYPDFFAWLVTITSNRFQLRYGEYQIKYPMTAWKLLKHMKAGTGLVKHRLTIVEGWTFSDIRAALLKDADLNQTLINQSNQIILQKLNAPEQHIEGLFYPNTYFFTWGNTDLSVLKTAYQKMQTILQTDWINRAANLPYQNAYQALIVASLIEKETSVAAEKPLISSVIVNRLAKNMRLQIDPTVQYGANQNFNNPITKKELTSKTPYNTYLMDGLPPTPICVPSESSIQAALHPAVTDYLYYVATGKGGHNFSATYAQHLQQVQEYRNTLIK